jgi:predicted nucleic-acid-binding Zn-ribbon protein
MPLSEQQRSNAQAFFTSKGVNHRCESCGSNDWAYGDVITGNPIMGGAAEIGGATHAMLQVACKECGYIRLYLARPMGVL